MATATLAYRPRSLWRFSRWDALFVCLTAMHAAALLLWPSVPLIAAGLWWNSNTIAHNFIHRPFFRSVAANRGFSAVLSLLLGIPQSLWRERHLAHHAEVAWHLRITRWLAVETLLVLTLGIGLASSVPRFFLFDYVPGYLCGLGLCWLQGHWEHACGRPTSHYGWLYNFLCFNDGFHAEHHADPSRHWTQLASEFLPEVATSRWPALFRWLEVAPLEALERVVLHSSGLQRWVRQTHRGAFRQLLPPDVRRIAIVGGGLYPRTALVLRELLPSAHLTVIDASTANLAIARRLVGDVDFRHERYSPARDDVFDLTVIPLCFQGDRDALYQNPPTRAVLVHDWIWRRRGRGAIVSPFLFKRINLVIR